MMAYTISELGSSSLGLLTGKSSLSGSLCDAENPLLPGFFHSFEKETILFIGICNTFELRDSLVCGDYHSSSWA